jgi:hypothetical protein
MAERANQHLIELHRQDVIAPGECDGCGQDNWRPGYDNGTETDYIGFQCLGCGNIVGMVRSEDEDGTARYDRTG